MLWQIQLDIEAGAFVTVALAVIVAILGAYIAYRISIREARREIAEAFERHIIKMHAEHIDFVETVRGAGEVESRED